MSNKCNLSLDMKNRINQLNDNHRDDVEEFILTRRRVDKVCDRSILIDVHSILIISRNTKKNFKDLTAEDLQGIEEKILSTPKIRRFKLNGKIQSKKTSEYYSKSAVSLYMTQFKNFMKFVYHPTEYKRGRKFRKKISDPSCVEWIAAHEQNNAVPADYIPKDSDIKKMLNACDNNLRDMAMVALFYDAGLRNQELCNLNVNSVTLDEQGGEVIIPIKADGNKTGTRRVFILSSVPYMKIFLNTHPYKEYRQAPLFFSRCSGMTKFVFEKSKNTLNPDNLEKLRLDGSAICKIIKDIGEEANIKCHIHPHLLRHASCTNYARLGLNESEMRVRYGWSKTSKMPSRYIHLASADMDDKILRLHGLKPKEEIQKERAVLAPLTCPDCGLENPPTFMFCGTCRMPLTIDGVDKTEVERTISGIKRIAKEDPTRMDELLTMLQEMKETADKKHVK